MHSWIITYHDLCTRCTRVLACPSLGLGNDRGLLQVRVYARTMERLRMGEPEQEWKRSVEVDGDSSGVLEPLFPHWDWFAPHICLLLAPSSSSWALPSISHHTTICFASNLRIAIPISHPRNAPLTSSYYRCRGVESTDISILQGTSTFEPLILGHFRLSCSHFCPNIRSCDVRPSRFISRPISCVQECHTADKSPQSSSKPTAFRIVNPWSAWICRYKTQHIPLEQQYLPRCQISASLQTQARRDGEGLESSRQTLVQNVGRRGRRLVRVLLCIMGAYPI